MPRDTLPDIPSDLSETETDLKVIESSFSRQLQAQQRLAKTHRKRDQKKRQRQREQLRQSSLQQHLPQEVERPRTVVVSPPQQRP